MRRIFLPALLVLSSFSVASAAQTLSSADQSFIDKHLSDVLTTKTSRISDAAVTKVFSSPFFKIDVVLKQGGDSSQTMSAIVAKDGDHLVTVDAPGTDSDLPALQKMFAPSFKLKTDADATALQNALNILYPPFGDEDKKAVKFTHTGTTWTFIRGKFFQDNKGFQFQTDSSGAITSAKYALKLH
jgi:hypothetical protein